MSARLAAFTMLLAASAIPAGAATPGKLKTLDSASIVEAVATMKPGDYMWAPELAPVGPLLLVVSLEGQRAFLYRNGVMIGVSTISTGKTGHETPTGVFTILQKKVDHKSNLYNSAPMPYMERLTWDGIALHAGNVPGYPASHGCIRLPMAFAKKLYGVSQLGATVVITGGKQVPRVAPTPSFLEKGADSSIAGLGEGAEWNPEKSPAGPVSILISAADKRLIVLRNGIPIGASPVEIPIDVTQPVAFSMQKAADGQIGWTAIPLSPTAETVEITEKEVAGLKLPEAFRARLAAILTPGTTVVVTPDTLLSGSPGQQITIMDSERTK